MLVERDLGSAEAHTKLANAVAELAKIYGELGLEEEARPLHRNVNFHRDRAFQIREQQKNSYRRREPQAAMKDTDPRHPPLARRDSNDPHRRPTLSLAHRTGGAMANAVSKTVPFDPGKLPSEAPLGERLMILTAEEEHEFGTRSKDGSGGHSWTLDDKSQVSDAEVLCWWELPKKPSELGREAARLGKQEMDCPYAEDDRRRDLWRSGFYDEMEQEAMDLAAS